MRRISLGLKAAVGSVAAVCAVAGTRDAAACGGCFHPPTQVVTAINDEKMLLAVSTAQSTLYDQISYTGTPTDFAWVLPIHGTVDVGLSADILFRTIDQLTEQTFNPPEGCPPAPSCGLNFGAGNAALGGLAADTPAVTVTKAETVGPYATVQLHSTDPNALSTWLAANGYNIPQDVTPVIAAYVAEGFDFLAMKLQPGQNVQSMRPVRVTTQGASLTLPLRMASVGTGVTVGITIWVVSDGRYEPANFPFFHIDDSQLVWDFSTNLSNYVTLEQQAETAAGNKNWEVQNSIDLNEVLIENSILTGGVYYGNLVGVSPSDASEDYLPIGDADAGVDAGADAGGYQSADQVRAADIATLFAGLSGPTVRVTRIRSDIAHAAMTTDFVLRASADQSELSNVHNITQSVNLVCPTYAPCTSTQGSSAVGANQSQAQSSGSGWQPVSGSGGGCSASPVAASPKETGFAVAGMVGVFAVLVGRSASARARRRRSQGK